MDLVMRASLYCVNKHKGQFRKGSGHPYASHPIAVSYIAAAFKRSKRLEEILAACVLHDVLEDTDATFEEIAKDFTPLVATLVFELTNDPVEVKRVGKLEYQKRKMLGISSYSLFIKLCDRYHNITDQPTEKMVIDTLELISFLEQNRKLSGSQSRLAEAIKAVCQNRIEEFNAQKG